MPANYAPMISIATDYQKDTGFPYPYLQGIAEAGFTHVHWCHHWCTDFIYSASEISQIQQWLTELGLQATDIHASAGSEKAWASAREYERLAGVELVVNRLEMAAAIGCDVAVLHIPGVPDDREQAREYWDRVRRSLDTLQQSTRATGVRIALENGGSDGSWVPLKQVFADYAPDFVGLCYDCGHGNMGGNGLGNLETHADRLIAIHLHDNDGTGDQHMLPFMGTVDWDRLIGLIAHSSYDKWVNLELSQSRSGYEVGNEVAFLREARQIADRLGAALDAARR